MDQGLDSLEALAEVNDVVVVCALALVHESADENLSMIRNASTDNNVSVTQSKVVLTSRLCIT